MLFVLIKDVFPCQFYIYRQMVDININIFMYECRHVYMYIGMYVRTLLSIYMSNMSGIDHEDLTINFDCIYCQNFCMKTKFILGFIYLYLLH